MGKTSLLQHVYKDDEITKEFDFRMWVCVSNNFDVKKVIADMLESLKKERPRLETLGELQGCLEEEVMSKKFLLVLDDIWEEDDEKDKNKWEDVLAPLAYGGFGSKILVTTRTDSVALMFVKVIKKKEKIVKLEGLEEDECLELLNSHAFAGVENPPDDHKKLSAIAREIVKKLLGSPLAAKVIGGVLKDNLDDKHWRIVLESNLLDQNSIHSILRLSYIVLPNHLRNCFAFCCMFPQDHTYHKDDLVRMWIALGFIQPSQAMTMEDIGGRYFDVFVKKALFDKVGDDYLRKIEKFKHLHSLFLFYKDSDQDLCSGLIETFKASRSLRLLCIFTLNLRMIPEEIGNLIHLRYLKIEGYNLTRLPRSISNLYHLRYLFPSDINNLSNLRYLRLPENYISLICGIGKLNSLQELDMFDLRNEIGFRIDELKYLNDLCKLGINCLENVKDAEEARNAQLCEKRRLTDLNLWWSNTYSRIIDLDENVLDNLQPPKCLRNLRINNYGGSRSAIWMNNVNPIFNLEKIELRDCLECETLPPFGQLPILKSLTLYNMPKIKCLESKFNVIDQYHAFPLLEVLCIERLEALEDWLGRYGEVETTNNCHLMLSSLEISDPSVLLMEPLRSIASLKWLSIMDNDELVLFSNEAEQWFLNNRSSHSELQFFCLKSLESLPSFLESLSSLQKLHISNVPLLRELPNLPPSLKRLSIQSCHPELFERYRKDGGSDRHKIAHIPDIFIR
ncbi:Disease resistance protein RGA2 [Dendrobium catenatum]|uniref:Disease resistance protein RGA2 n=1 Tax=Dendrobium catenatum TaxID=906689 RepID=A0A2I0VZU1_9ASPA|nr:Disease resistance protein RGA2 [Dendrobium catenatum]